MKWLIEKFRSASIFCFVIVLGFCFCGLFFFIDLFIYLFLLMGAAVLKIGEYSAEEIMLINKKKMRRYSYIDDPHKVIMFIKWLNIYI